MARFDQIWNDAFALDNCDDEQKNLWHYFKGIRTMLMKKGFRVFHSRVSWAEGVEKRADDFLKNVQKTLETTGAETVNIIAHSMGGLDTRHMLFNDQHQGQIHKHVASVTTISTPHWGSYFADWGIKNMSYVIPVADKLGLDLTALKDLAVEACSRFNQDQAVMDFEDACESTIKFQTYAGRRSICID